MTSQKRKHSDTFSIDPFISRSTFSITPPVSSSVNEPDAYSRQKQREVRQTERDNAYEQYIRKVGTEPQNITSVARVTCEVLDVYATQYGSAKPSGYLAQRERAREDCIIKDAAVEATLPWMALTDADLENSTPYKVRFAVGTVFSHYLAKGLKSDQLTKAVGEVGLMLRYPSECLPAKEGLYYARVYYFSKMLLEARHIYHIGRLQTWVDTGKYWSENGPSTVATQFSSFI